VFDIPNVPFQFELREFTGIDRKPRTHRGQDPGNVLLNIDVTDVDLVAARTKMAGGTIVTTGGEPFTRNQPATTQAANATRAAYVADLDGYVWYLEQFIPESRSHASDQVVLGADAIRITNSSVDVAAFWKPFGVDVHSTTMTTVPAEKRSNDQIRLSATPGYGLRFSDVVITVSNRHFQVEEWLDGERRPYVGKPQDPGTPTISLLVSDIAAASKAARASGASIVTRGGTVRLGRQNGSALLIRGPDQLLIELVQRSTTR
jgi:hypothetical protein